MPKFPKKADSRWNDDFYVTAYELAKQGLTIAKIAQALGVSDTTLKKWIKDRPALKAAIRKGKGLHGQTGEKLEVTAKTETFIDYVYQQLPPNLREAWDKISAWENEPNGYARIEAFLNDQGKQVRQHLFVHAMVASHFNASEACRILHITAKTYHDWRTDDLEFARLLDEIIWHKKNFFESQLIGLVAQGDTSATIFVNKTQNRDRGYDPRVEIKISGGLLNANVDLDKLDLPLEVRRQLLQALRQGKELPAAEEEVRNLGPVKLVREKKDD